jgi:hypothetical protein
LSLLQSAALPAEGENMSTNLKRRLAQAERMVAELLRRRKLANCNCQQMMSFRTPEHFEEEKNLPCPGHGFRDLGAILILTITEYGKTRSEEARKLEQLVADYETARARHRAELELEEDGTPEL